MPLVMLGRGPELRQRGIGFVYVLLPFPGCIRTADPVDPVLPPGRAALRGDGLGSPDRLDLIAIVRLLGRRFPLLLGG